MLTPNRTLLFCIYLISVGCVLFNAESNRQILVFLVSFTFQTNTVIFIYVALGYNLSLYWRGILQRIGVVWSIFMALVWAAFFAGKENHPNEALLNHALHYYTPFLFMVDWLILHPTIPWPSDRFLVIPTFLSGLMIYCVGRLHLGYHIYPMFDFIDLLFMPVHWYTSFHPVVFFLYIFFGSIGFGFGLYLLLFLIALSMITYQINLHVTKTIKPALYAYLRNVDPDNMNEKYGNEE
jgi:hypothetical protein